MSVASIWPVAKEAGLQWVAHKDARMGAALSYYSVFSIGPLILIAVAVAGLVFGPRRSRASHEFPQGLLGENGAQAINGMLASAAKPQEGLIATVVGVVMLVFAAIGVVVQLKDAFNTVWEIEEPKAAGIWGFVRTYVLSFAAVLTIGFLLIVSMVMTAALAAAGEFVGSFVPEAALQVTGFAVSFAICPSCSP